jgi:flagellar hook-length control protein FliK
MQAEATAGAGNVQADDTQDGAQPAGKPAPKGGKTANDNQPAGNQIEGNQTSTAQQSAADPNLLAIAQATQLAAQAPQPQAAQAAAADDEGSDGEEPGAVGATGKPGAKPASAGQGQPGATAPAASDPAATSQSPVAAAQAAIRGASDNANSNNASGDTAAGTDKPASKTADSNSAPQVQPHQQQPQQPQSPAPSMTAAAIPTAANGMPVQTTGAAHNVAASVQVAPQTAAAPNVNSLAVEIAARSQSGAKQFEIRLDPPELGRVDVRLSIDATGKAEAHLTADQPETLSLLQKDSGTLRRCAIPDWMCRRADSISRCAARTARPAMTMAAKRAVRVPA